MARSWKKRQLVCLSVAAAMLEYYRPKTIPHRRRRRSRQTSGKKRHRRRQSVQSVYAMLGPYYFQRAFRMSYESFLHLSSLLADHMIRRNHTMSRCNGPILPSVRLACALRYFAGGSNYDIATTFGIAPSEIFESVWEVVDAVNRFPGFMIELPASHEAQHELAAGFKGKSEAYFDCCVGAVDGILIWIHRPSKSCCDAIGCDAGKFFCGRKNKFGFNCQAVCDSVGRFLDISLLYPGSTADCVAFEGMALYKKLDDGLLAPGLCLFGDNAYLNAPYMATPYSGGALNVHKDSYNFYHSQLRIQIECAFGKFTHRWGILRSALPKRMSLKKSVSLVLALARLHNFCIDQKQAITNPPAVDEINIEVAGGVPLEQDQVSQEAIPRQLFGGGEHFEDMDRNERRRRQRMFAHIQLPRERLLASVIDQGLRRPAIRVQGA